MDKENCGLCLDNLEYSGMMVAQLENCGHQLHHHCLNLLLAAEDYSYSPTGYFFKCIICRHDNEVTLKSVFESGYVGSLQEIGKKSQPIIINSNEGDWRGHMIHDSFGNHNIEEWEDTIPTFPTTTIELDDDQISIATTEEADGIEEIEMLDEDDLL